ncbi:MAG TPA: hypothetical protein VGS22_04475 [Thermoanaerobaculia bacterium]|nr:hypothetical protein [Thermoanaerobaculia bacterium]
MTAKQAMIQLLEQQPDDSSADELLREIAFVRMVDRGLADSDQGRTIDHEEVAERIASWGR